MEYGGHVPISEGSTGGLVFRNGGADMKSIDKDIVIPADGTLPQDFREAFGRKVHVVVYLNDDEAQIAQTCLSLMSLAGKVRAFRDVDDPVGLQRDLRNSWERGWGQ